MKITVQQLIRKLQWSERSIELEIIENNDQLLIVIDKEILNRGEDVK
jgi:hypothetical protein